MNLPEDFISRMQILLQEEADIFFKSYTKPTAYGLRVNLLKYGDSFSEKALPFTLSPIAWAREGFYAVPEEHPGKHPLHEGGAYYIQEPSAMSAVSLLDPKPGETICDLCAAPGSKSTQIAGRMDGTGLLVSNEIIPERSKILSQNIERFGVRNCVACNEPPEKMAAHFPLFFDKILVDAPCSGEGMFRKDNNAIHEWSAKQIQICRKRQAMILECASQMLTPGGVLVYSTCTFAPEENEQMIAWFLNRHPDYIIEDWRDFLPKNSGLEGGRSNFLSNGNDLKGRHSNSLPNDNDPENMLRLWPHNLKGEGHFAARLRKTGEPAKQKNPKKTRRKKQADISGYQEFAEQFIDSKSALNAKFLTEKGTFQYFGDSLYWIPAQMNTLTGLKTVRAGLHLGIRKKNRLEPAHALAMALTPKDAIWQADCSYADAIRYLRGEPIPCDSTFRSWTLICYQGISLGWGKAQNGLLKNHYPKGLRKQIDSSIKTN